MPKFSIPRLIELQYGDAIAELIASLLPIKQPGQSAESWVQQLADLAHNVNLHYYARVAAEHMVSKVNTTNAKSWREASAKSQRSRVLYRAMQEELAGGVRPHFNRIVDRNAELIKSIPSDVATMLNRHIVEAQQSGLRAGTVTAMLRTKFPEFTKNKIKLIARTQAQAASTDLTEARSLEIGLDWAEWDTSEDKRVRPSHKNMDGVLFSWHDLPSPEALAGEKSSLGKYAPGRAPNCFPGDTVVSSPSGIKKLWRAPYSGDLIELKMGDGTIFSATPNHPVLTSHGWVAMRLLNEGDQLLHDGRLGNSVEKMHLNQSVTTFEDMFITASRHGNKSVDFGLDFHGDVIDDYIDVVSVDRDLNFHIQPSFAQRGGNSDLTNSDTLLMDTVAGIMLEIGESSSSGLGDQVLPLLRGTLSHADLHSLCTASRSYSSRDQLPSYGASTSTEERSHTLLAPLLLNIELSNFLDRKSSLCDEASTAQGGVQSTSGAFEGSGNFGNSFSGIVKSSRIAKKSIRVFSGHIYTLESEDGWYKIAPTGIITKNCRCIPSPLLTLDQVSWPHRVYHAGQITRMTRAQFQQLTGIPARRKAA